MQYVIRRGQEYFVNGGASALLSDWTADPSKAYHWPSEDAAQAVVDYWRKGGLKGKPIRIDAAGKPVLHTVEESALDVTSPSLLERFRAYILG